MKAELIDFMGSDLSVVNAARVSFDKTSNWDIEWVGQKGFESILEKRLKAEDAKLIHYLARHNHWTPFAHTSVSLRMQAPVPIRTQCFKHKQGLVENEESRRYISSEPTFYTPDYFRMAPTGGAKQGSSGSHPNSAMIQREYIMACCHAIDVYQQMIADGVCPEQARFVLPQGCEVQWIWTGNVFAFSNFFNKRTDPHAQREIQDLARMVGEIIEPLFPVSWKALTNA